MAPKTHRAIDPRLCGEIQELGAGTSVVQLRTTAEMQADDRGLVHGGFVFGLADFAAMMAINEPTVVLGSASVRFTRPSIVGDVLQARARVDERQGKKHIVEVEVACGDDLVFGGTFVCLVPRAHVLDPTGRSA